MTERAAQPEGDEAAIARIPDVIAVHRNTTSWYNNASFALPLLATIGAGIVAAVLRNRDIGAFALFLLVVTLLMIPVVLSGWKRTATAVVLSREGITALHGGRTLKELRWDEVVSLTRREVQGNVRWIVKAENGDHIALDGELENLDQLLAAIRRLAHLPDDLQDET
jgi:hypothetical protein